ncbi:MAG: helix-turn-helix domain-containing protein [Betaproteobacteria bacterium]|nr:helix-turn-helix domain-containing protein [Betaproteobacteria bacterium]MDH4323554.1 helix-turn-helix domain-containing protein [Betaproteobacteria bacterium]
MLHAYRCGHQVLSRWMRAAVATLGAERREQAVSAVSDLGIEYTNAISAVLTAEYVAHTRQMAQAEGDRRADTLNALLNPEGGVDGHDAQLLKRAGYLEPNQAFCVVVAQSTDPLEMNSVPRVQRIVEAMSSAVTSEKIKALIGVRNNVVTAVYADWQRQSGWTAPRASLADRVERMLLILGPAVLIGVSREHGSVALVPKAMQEAIAALGCAHVGERVVKFGALPMRRLLLVRGGDYVRAALPPWVADFATADAKARGALVETLRAYADADMNLIRAARVLHVHPNTLYARMQRINQLTGLNSQRYHDLNELLLAVDCQGV